MTMNRLTAKLKSAVFSRHSGRSMELTPGGSIDRHAHGKTLSRPLSRKAFCSDRNVSNKTSEGDTPHALLYGEGFLMHVTIDFSDVTELRHRVMASCADLVTFIRIQPLAHASRMRMWIGLKREEFDLVSRTIRATFPLAEFKRFKQLRHL